MLGRRPVADAGRWLVVGLLAIVLAVPAGRAAAGEPEAAAEQVVRGLAADIWSNFEQPTGAERKNRLAGAIRARTDVDLLSRLALGRNWRALDQGQRTEYQQLFSTVIIDALAARLDSYVGRLSGPLDQHFRITGSRPAGERDVFVRSKVMGFDGQPLSVDWRLRPIATGPVIIDLIIEGVSLLVSQRAEFAAVIERSQTEGLIAALRRRATAPSS